MSEANVKTIVARLTPLEREGIMGWRGPAGAAYNVISEELCEIGLLNSDWSLSDLGLAVRAHILSQEEKTSVETGAELLERWPGYNEQSWQRRFVEMERQYHDLVSRVTNALCARAALTSTPDAMREACRACKGCGGVQEDMGDGQYVGAQCPFCHGHGYSEDIEDAVWSAIMEAQGPDSNARDYARAALLAVRAALSEPIAAPRDNDGLSSDQTGRARKVFTDDPLTDRMQDHLDARADEWLAESHMVSATHAMCAVFDKYSSREILERFRKMLEAHLHLSFVEGGLHAWAEISTQQRALGSPLPAFAPASAAPGEDAQ